MSMIYLISHGPTGWDQQGKILGQKDESLSQEGMNQSRMMGNMLKGKAFSAIFSSDLNRAYATASEIALHYNLSPIIDERLNDWNMGIWEGLTMPELLNIYDEKYKDWKSSPLTTRMTHGETLQEVINRVSEFYRDVVCKQNQDFAVVAHKQVHLVLASLIEGKDPKTITFNVLMPSADANCRSYEVK